jgi:hypothetical protein
MAVVPLSRHVMGAEGTIVSEAIIVTEWPVITVKRTSAAYTVT